MPNYKYATAHEWLFQSSIEASDARIDELLKKVDGEDIQELFQNEMEEDGFFVDLDETFECNICGAERIVEHGYDIYCSGECQNVSLDAGNRLDEIIYNKDDSDVIKMHKQKLFDYIAEHGEFPEGDL